jgi:hypothetical protein
MTERDWDKDFDLAAWQALDARSRKDWVYDAWIRERDDDDATDLRRRRYERGQTPWDVGLEPHPFDVTLAEAIDVVKPEHWEGRVFGNRDVRHRVLSALLANAGLRRTVRLAPRHLWEEVVQARVAERRRRRALAADHVGATRTADVEPPEPTPVTRPEFVAPRHPAAFLLPWYWVRSEMAQPFEQWDRNQHGGDVHAMRVLQLGYVALGDQTLTRSDLLVLREAWRPRTWPTAGDAALIVYVASAEGALLFDWQVRRPAQLEAGTQEVSVVDTARQRILRQRRGEEPLEVRYSATGQTTTWQDEQSAADVVLELKDIFHPAHKSTAASVDEHRDFASFNAAQVARLQRFDTPWTVGHTPQWFRAGIEDLVGRFKDELWAGVLYGAEYQRDELLSALLANVGLEDVVDLAPLELWEQALAES